MKNNKNTTPKRSYLIVARLATIALLAFVLVDADIVTASSTKAKYIVATILATLLTAVFAEKLLRKLVAKLSK
jgi:hypothetical protein